MKMLQRKIGMLCTIALVCFFAVQASAQVTWMRSYQNYGGSIEYCTGSGNRFGDHASSYTLLLNGHVRLSSRVVVVAQVPFSHYKHNFPSLFGLPEVNSTPLGNPYLGIEVARQDRSSGIFQTGVRLPVTKEHSIPEYEALRNGQLINFEQVEAFEPELYTAHMAGGLQLVKNSQGKKKLVWKSVLGVTFAAGNSNEGELFGDLNTALLIPTQYVNVSFGSIVNALITQKGIDFFDRFAAAFGIRVVSKLGPVRPSVAFHVPLTSNIQKVTSYTTLFGLGIDFGGTGAHTEDSGK